MSDDDRTQFFDASPSEPPSRVDDPRDLEGWLVRLTCEEERRRAEAQRHLKDAEEKLQETESRIVEIGRVRAAIAAGRPRVDPACCPETSLPEYGAAARFLEQRIQAAIDTDVGRALLNGDPKARLASRGSSSGLSSKQATLALFDRTEVRQRLTELHCGEDVVSARLAALGEAIGTNLPDGEAILGRANPRTLPHGLMAAFQGQPGRLAQQFRHIQWAIESGDVLERGTTFCFAQFDLVQALELWPSFRTRASSQAMSSALRRMGPTSYIRLFMETIVEAYLWRRVMEDLFDLYETHRKNAEIVRTIKKCVPDEYQDLLPSAAKYLPRAQNRDERWVLIRRLRHQAWKRRVDEINRVCEQFSLDIRSRMRQFAATIISVDPTERDR